jgi:hypothetical protein
MTQRTVPPKRQEPDMNVSTQLRLAAIARSNPHNNPHARSLTGSDAAWIGALCLIAGLILGACVAGVTMP